MRDGIRYRWLDICAKFLPLLPMRVVQLRGPYAMRSPAGRRG